MTKEQPKFEMVKIDAQVFIPEISVYWNEQGTITIRQEADQYTTSDDSLVTVDVWRARLLIKALTAAIKAE